MSHLFRLARFALLPLAIVLSTAGCHKNPAPVQPDNNQAGAQDQSSDPAAANLPPVPDNSGAPGYASNAAPSGQQSPPPPDQNNASSQSGQSSYDPGYGEQPEYTASQPPPPLPDYDQPPIPGDDYIWTPGYWAWSPDGYYWVPGAWVEAPYMGALWTPGYWGFYGGRYLFYPGYWGLHIGFYGGINYGFGYLGFGYEGGYWNSGRFFYNRAYNHINERVVHNVYEYHAPARGYNAPRGNYSQRNNNAPGGNNNSRTSYRGGPGGVQSHPQPSEGAAWHEPTAPRMNTQVQHAQTYQTNRGQLATQNHGQPRTPAVRQPVPAQHNVQPTVRANTHSGGSSQQHR